MVVTPTRQGKSGRAASRSLQQAIRDQDKAYAAFFQHRAERNAGKRGGRVVGLPRFKSRKRSPLTFRLPQSLTLRRNRLSVPKVGEVKLILHRWPEGTLKSATFRQDATGHWYVSLVYHVELPEQPAAPVEPSVGLDLGLKDLVVTSAGERTPAPRHYRAAERKLTRLQRHLSRCSNGSRNREKARRKVARQHQRVANLRSDTLHKLSHTLTRDYTTICIEDLHVAGLGKTNLGKSVQDAAWATLRAQLAYKAHWRGKRLVVIGRFFPSSRLCPVCGCSNQTLALRDRVWC